MRFCRGKSLGSFLVLAALVVSFSSARADVPFPSFPKSDALNNLSKMRNGLLNVKDKPEYANAFADLASWMADRLAHPPFNGEEPKVKPTRVENIDTLLEEVEFYCTVPPRPKTNVDELNNQLDNIRVFAQKMDERIQYVMKESQKRLVKVNAARMLALVGRLPTDAMVDSYLKMIRDDKYPPEVKLYVFQGLGNVLAAVDPKDPTKGVIPDMDKMAEICKELEKYITFTNPIPNLATVSTEAYAEWAAPKQFVRREAIRALAQVRYSVIRNRQRQPIARPLWTLLRVARHNPRVDTAIVPLVSDSERYEAVIGICLMRPDNLVNLDSVAYRLSDVLLDLGVQHNDQKAQFQKNPRYKPVIPWKLLGYRLSEAMKTWKANVQTLPAAQSAPVIKLIDAATTRFITRMETEGLSAVPDSQPLVSWKSANKPKVAQVFSDDPMSGFPVE